MNHVTFQYKMSFSQKYWKEKYKIWNATTAYLRLSGSTLITIES